MAANALGFSYSDVLRNAESIKTARLQREGMTLDNDIKRQALEDKKTASTQTTNALGLRARAVGGDKEALQEYVALDPAGAKTFMDSYAAMTEPERVKQREGIEFMGRAAAYVLQSEDPAAAYAQLYESAPPEIQAQLPPTYDERFVTLQLAKARELDDMVEAYDASQKAKTEEAATIAKEQREEQRDIRKDERKFAADVKLETLKAEMEKSASGGSREMKSADTNAIYRQAGAFFDGIFGPDEDGDGVPDVRLTDPNDAAKLQRLAAEASKVWANGSMTHAEAVEQAANSLNFGLKRKATPEDADPLGLFTEE